MYKTISLLLLVAVAQLQGAQERSSGPRARALSVQGEWRGTSQLRKDIRDDFGDIDSATYAGIEANRNRPHFSPIRSPRSVSSSPIAFRGAPQHRNLVFAESRLIPLCVDKDHAGTMNTLRTKSLPF